MPDQSSAARPWRWLAALAIIGNVALNAYSNLHPFNGQTMGMVSDKYPTVLTPDDYAFGIWGLIFLALVIYAVWQLLPGQATNSLPDHIAKPLTLASVATMAWVVLFSYELILLSILAMAVILFGLIITYGQTREAVLTKTASAWVSVPFALYLGWISVAAVINLTIGLQQMGFQLVEPSAVKVAYGVLVIIVILTLLVAGSARDLLYPVAPVWALVAIWVVRVHDEPLLGWAALGSAVLTVLLSFALVRQRGKLQPWEIATEAAAAEAERIRTNA